MKAIDLYSGVGGWSLGLRMAGVEVVRSYEWWKDANLTNSLNNSHDAECVNIRDLDASSFPSADIVVGSPPCTQFSLANRGGKGNILDGLKDVEKFLEVVDFVKPRFWAMENVPRLASILSDEFNQGGYLHRFARLNPEMIILDASEFGVPQRRKRLVFGNLDFDLLLSYRDNNPTRTLGDVVGSFGSGVVDDPVYGIKIPVGELVDHVEEMPLSPEEERINREVKTNHPIYNDMSFPDRLDRPSRTITATSTRVSRESIIIPCEGGFRRPTLREQASLQSFPITYQFHASSHAQKQRMIGNAIPPLLTYHLAQSMLGTKPCDLPPLSLSCFSPARKPPETKPDRPSSSFPPNRKFRFSVPNLRFKSGVRFELSNSGGWKFRFFYGNSKNIKEIQLDSDLLDEMSLVEGVSSCKVRAKKFLVERGVFSKIDPRGLQDSWSHSKDDAPRPFDLMDFVGLAVSDSVKYNPSTLANAVVSGLMASRCNPNGFKKLIRHAPEIFAGFLVCSLANEMFSGKSFLEDSN